MISKARKMMWTLFKIAKATGKSNWFGPIIWGKYAIPNILFGTEAMVLSATTINKLQTIQNRYLKMCCGASQYTPTASVILHTGIYPIKFEYEKRLINYFIHCHKLPWHKMTKQALLQQKMWAYSESTTNWYDKARKILQDRDMWQKFTDQSTDITQWSKLYIKNLLKISETRMLREKLSRRQELTHLHSAKIGPCKLTRMDNDSKYWLIIRMGGLILPTNHDIIQPTNTNQSNRPDLNMCPVCEEENDSIPHVLLHCKEIHRTTNINIPGWSEQMSVHYKNTIVESNFLHSVFDITNKTEDEILQLGLYIKIRLKVRIPSLR